MSWEEGRIYKNGKKHGNWINYFEDGDIVERGINNHYGNYNPEEIVIPSFFKKEEDVKTEIKTNKNYIQRYMRNMWK